MKLLSHSSFFTLTTFAILSAGCSGIVGTLERPEDYKPDVGVQTAALTPAHTCDNLLAFLKQDAIEKIDAHIDNNIAQWEYYDRSNYGYYDESVPAASAPDDASSNKDASASPGSAGASAEGTQAPNRATEHSDTNTQVKGVDEADIVKNDGKFIYLLRGSNFVVLNAWPATELAQNYSFGIEGTPIEMFVRDSKQVVIYSRVDGTPIYESAGLQPRYHYYDNYGPSYVGGTSDIGSPGYTPGYYANPLTKITVLQLQDNNEQPQVVKEVYFEGEYTSSRRMDNYVRTITNGAAYGPSLTLYLDDYYSIKTQAEWTAKWEQLREENHEIINNSTIADWMPYSFVRAEDGVGASLAPCEQAYIPTVRSTNAGMTQMFTFNLDDILQDGPVTSIIGATDTVYANNETLVLGAQAWVHPNVWSRQWDSDGDDTVMETAPNSMGSQASPLVLGSSRQAIKEIISTSYTHVHQFDLDSNPLVPIYKGSSTVPGNVLNQFFIDVHKGFVRIATTDDRLNTPVSRVNHVFILQSDGTQLKLVGSIQDLAPDESIFSARFMGDRGYLVTYRQIDPLFVLDLADPTAPSVLGELKIPGFSEYMHPLDDNHLLTIGESENRGLALQIFDVSDPVNPIQAHKYEYEAWTSSEAQYNHKAFTYFDSKKLLAFPMTGDWDYMTNTIRSTLEVFDIDVVKGINPRGSIDHSSFYTSEESAYPCYGYYTPSVRRGVFMDDFVYAISNGGVTVHSIDDLTTPVASLPLTEPVDSSCYYDERY